MSAGGAVAQARRRAVIGAVIAATLLLGGCASAPTYDPDTAEQLQQQVLDVTTASAEGAYDVARTGLLELEADARDAHARGLITAERLDSILAAIVLVTASLDAEIAAAEQAEAERLAAEEAARAAEEARQAAEQEAAEREERGNDNRGGEGRGGRGRDDDGD